VITHLKTTLENLIKKLFGQQCDIRFYDSYFPFTDPSFELEVMFNGKWLELLGCGLIQKKILEKAGITNKIGWAFGMGLELIAMVLFGIPDIRLIWTTDSRFSSQFTSIDSRFKLYSNQPACYKDITYWLVSENYPTDNDIFETTREICGDLVESVTLLDKFVSTKMNKTSKCYRIAYRSMDRTLTNSEINVLHNKLVDSLVEKYGITTR
jgi:phenylalanyl-tRNA synthetase alpha chain